MSEMKHKSLRDEILYVIGRATAPLSGPEVYERVELAEEMKQVSNALFQLKDAEKIVRVDGDGRARYRLADGVAAPAPAGKAGRSKAVQKDDAQQAAAPIRPAAQEAGPPALDIPAHDNTAPKEPATLRERAAAEAAYRKSDGSTPYKSDAALADAILARLKRQLTPTLAELEASVGLDRLNVHIHIEQVDIHLGGL